jgi:short-subunit dehydrogenase
VQVTVASVMGLVGACQLSDYAASKAALMTLHESLRYELDKRYNAPKVRTTLVLPGFIQTPMFSRAAWPKSRLWNFFVPSLQPITVVKAIIRALDNTHSENINLPFYVNFAFALRAMPSFARDFCQWVCALGMR